MCKFLDINYNISDISDIKNFQYRLLFQTNSSCRNNKSRPKPTITEFRREASSGPNESLRKLRDTRKRSRRNWVGNKFSTEKKSTSRPNTHGSRADQEPVKPWQKIHPLARRKLGFAIRTRIERAKAPRCKFRMRSETEGAWHQAVTDEGGRKRGPGADHPVI